MLRSEAGERQTSKQVQDEAKKPAKRMTADQRAIYESKEYQPAQQKRLEYN